MAKTPQPEASVETVTPKTAQNWLGGKTRNRSVRASKVLEYAIDMEAETMWNGDTQLRWCCPQCGPGSWP